MDDFGRHGLETWAEHGQCGQPGPAARARLCTGWRPTGRPLREVVAINAACSCTACCAADRPIAARPHVPVRRRTVRHLGDRHDSRLPGRSTRSPHAQNGGGPHHAGPHRSRAGDREVPGVSGACARRECGAIGDGDAIDRPEVCTVCGAADRPGAPSGAGSAGPALEADPTGPRSRVMTAAPSVALCHLDDTELRGPAARHARARRRLAAAWTTNPAGGAPRPR